ncbi:hypothetical protein AK830_g7880 [Neonectria ditissima]|uniref:Aldehyde dehydrogenase domain-containing protein n=1 Tax=Neonectria ditissima TaxID=78410 RepID=A0A0P7BCQ5_9HYPO|nr:hypothetical protein AK830_g7880 [Neonectria ditissima]
MPDSNILFTTENVVVDATSKHHHHLGLWPPPSSDEKDPLRWPTWVKILALISVAFSNFVANFAGSGLSVATVLLEMQFHKTASEVNALMTLDTYRDLLLQRVKYVVLISCGSAVGPLIGGFMVESSPGTWRDFAWLCAALSGFDLLAIFVLYPESSFIRPPISLSPPPNPDQVGSSATKTELGTIDGESRSEHLESGKDRHGPVKVSFLQVWTSFVHYNRIASLPKAFAMPFVFLGCLPVLWTILVYGGALASQVILIFAFPSLLLAPPYLFASSSVGLMQVAAIIGFVIACYGGGYICDVITAKCIVRNGGVFIPEQRLKSLAPGCLVAPIGCVIVAFACDRSLHWAAIAVGFGMVSFGTVYAPNVAMTYLLDSYPIFAQEILVAINVTKNLVAFLFFIRVPLLINGVPVFEEARTRIQEVSPLVYFQGARTSDCNEAINSSSNAFGKWSQTSPLERRRLLLKLAQILSQREAEAKEIMQTEIHCSEGWAARNVSDSIALIEESASLITSNAMGGSIPHTEVENSYGFVFNRPLGVVLGIAPWNGPLILGFRAVVAPVATGNTAILKGSELSPRSHHFIAQLFLDAGFPPGVVNFILHRPEDAAEIVETLKKHSAIRKVNFTGSTAVGRIIAQMAGKALKPVLLELGGKNCSIILKDANVAKAAAAALEGATLNGGQICMSTDLAIVARETAQSFRDELRKAFYKVGGTSHKVISSQSAGRSQSLFADAAAKGAKVLSSAAFSDSRASTQAVPVSIIEDVQPSMEFFSAESFGPILGMVVVESEDEAIDIVNGSDYGLSAAIWTHDYHRALRLARRLDVGAVHINASTVHDEATLPHGGSKSSGFGRFGAEWGLKEFVQTQTVTMNPW